MHKDGGKIGIRENSTESNPIFRMEKLAWKSPQCMEGYPCSAFFTKLKKVNRLQNLVLIYELFPLIPTLCHLSLLPYSSLWSSWKWASNPHSNKVWKIRDLNWNLEGRLWSVNFCENFFPLQKLVGVVLSFISFYCIQFLEFIATPWSCRLWYRSFLEGESCFSCLEICINFPLLYAPHVPPVTITDQ